MGSVTLSIPSLVQGMSQQSSRLRRVTEAEYVENGISDLSRGLGNRPGTYHGSILPGRLTRASWVHWVDRDAAEKYVLSFDGSAFRATGLLDGLSYPIVEEGSALAYLASSRPSDALFGLTVQDTTFVVNRERFTALAPTTAPAITPQALVWVRAGNYRTNYSITVNGTTVTHVTPLSTDSGGEDAVRTTSITTALGSALAAALGVAFVVTTVAASSLILIRRDDGADFTCQVDDSVGNSQLALVKNQAARFDLLPDKAPHGYVAHLVGLDGVSADDYWVRFVAEEGNEAATVSAGRWEETAAPGSLIALDASTMPHRIDRRQDDAAGTVTGVPFQVYFRLAPCEWKTKPAGDDETSKAPSFVGRRLDSLFLLSDRLGFLSGSQILLSRARDFFQLWRTSMLSLGPDDRIDATAATADAVDVRHAVTLSEQVLFVGDRVVMALPTDVAIAPDTFRLTASVAVRVDTGVAPLQVGRSLFLPFAGTTYSGVREAQASGVERVKDSVPITQTVPSLLDGRILAWTADQAETRIFALTSGSPRRIYVYTWLDAGQERLLSSWGVWTSSDPVVALRVIQDRLWLLVDRPDGTTIEYMPLDPDEAPAGHQIPYRLDRLIRLTDVPVSQTAPPPPVDPPPGGGGGGGGGADPVPGLEPAPGGPTPVGGSNPANQDPEAGAALSTPTTPRTVFELPYEPPTRFSVVRGDTGQLVTWRKEGPRRISLEGLLSDVPLVAGERYDFLYVLSEPHVRRRTSTGGETAVTNGRLQLLRFRVNHEDSGAYMVDVFDGEQLVYMSPWSPTVLGGAVLPFDTGTHSVPIRMQSTRARVRLRSPWHMPCWFISAEWEADFTKYGAPAN